MNQSGTGLPRRIVHGFAFLLLGGAMYLAGVLLMYDSIRTMAKKSLEQLTENSSIPGGTGFLILSFLAYATAAWGVILIVAGLIDHAKQPRS